MELVALDRTTGKSRIPLDKIDADTITTVEEAYTYCQANPDKRLQTPDYASKTDAENFLKAARSYAYQRPEGRVVVSGNPAAGSTKGKYVVRFVVEPYFEQDDDGE
jgi:hypothetical protein